MTIETPMPATPRLIHQAVAGVYEITISNPARRNAMTLRMWRDLALRVREAAEDPGIRTVLIRGDGGRAFCSGSDISEFDTLRSSAAQVTEYSLVVDEAQHALIQCEKPTVALIRGTCMGGGMEIAAACDIRYASESAQFRMPAGLVGLAYSLAGVARMMDILGAPRVADIFMTSRTFGGAEAARIGFVQEAFSDSRYDAETAARIGSLVASAPLSIRATKLAMRYLSDERDLIGAQRASRAHDACFASRDYSEGQQAFKEKRKPLFRGV